MTGLITFEELMRFRNREYCLSCNHPEHEGKDKCDFPIDTHGKGCECTHLSRIGQLKRKIMCLD